LDSRKEDRVWDLQVFWRKGCFSGLTSSKVSYGGVSGAFIERSLSIEKADIGNRVGEN
jgi:hypothetical protein